MSASLRVCSFESRRGREMASLLARCDAAVTIAPSLREVPLENNREAIEFARALVDGIRPVEVLILLTGVGTRTLFEACCTAVDRQQFLDALGRLTIIVRGPKPVAVLREWNVHFDLRAPEPNTWREVVACIDDAGLSLTGKSAVVQEYGIPTPELYEALRERGANVWPVPVYQWELPEDTGPLQAAVRGVVAGEFDLLMYTSAQQVRNVLEVARSLGLEPEFRAAAARCLTASIGPTTTETLVDAGFPSPLEPSHPKMGHLVTETCAEARRILNRPAP